MKRIVNISKDNQQMHILPPTTPYFTIQYSKKRSSIVPGLSLDVIVKFRPTEWRYYYDTIKVHCKHEENLLVPIHAYPVLRTDQFPRNFRFPAVPIGQHKTKTFCLQSDVPVAFEFKITFLQSHPTFTVQPLSGIVPGHGKAEVSVTFAPNEFNTAVMTLQLELSQFNCSPVVCTFTGNSSPEIAAEESAKHQPSIVRSLTSRASRSHTLPPLDKTTPREKSKKNKTSKKWTIYEGIRFPSNLDTPSTVGKILAQRSGKMKASELRQVTSEDDTVGSSYQLKEAMYIKKVTQAASEEKANQLRRVTVLGGTAMTVQEREAVLQVRMGAVKAYQHATHMPATTDEACQRTHTVCVHRRTRRKIDEHPSCVPNFDPCRNDMWAQRYRALERFVQAARKVLVRLRCERRLRQLQKALRDESDGVQTGKVEFDASEFVSASILPIVLPLHSAFQGLQKSGTCQAFEIKPLALAVKRPVPVMNLEVPKQFELMEYAPLPPPSEYSYFPPGYQRPFRSGAQDELKSLSAIPGVNPVFLEDNYNPTVTTASNATVREASQATETDCIEELALQPPSYLSKPQRLHPLHIFDPSPGVRHFVPMLPHSEASLEHSLLPLPPYPSPKQKYSLDPQDIIPDLMKWKQFPAHCLIAMEKEKAFCTVWKPRWSDPFAEDTPEYTDAQFLTGPHPDDNMDESSQENVIVPTLEMVRAQFHIPEFATRDPRSQAKEEFRAGQLCKVNQLGESIQRRLKAMEPSKPDTSADTAQEIPL
eukprot:Em0004g137a